MLADYLTARLGLPSLTKRASAIVVAGVVLIFASIFAAPHPGYEDLADKMLLTGIALVGFTLAYSSIYSIKAAALRRLIVRRRVPLALVEGQEARIVLELENPSPVGLELLEVVDAPPLYWEMKGHHGILNVPPNGKARLVYTVRPILGQHLFGWPRIVYRDPLGLVHVEKIARIDETVRVQPRLLPAPKAGMRIAVAQQPAGQARTRRRGIGSEFLELREYQPGDEIRYIDWKATARTGRLMVKVMEKEVVNRILAVIDLTETMYAGIPGDTKAEYAARIVASLSEYLARRGDYYRIAVSSRTGSLVSTSWLRGRASSVLARRFIAESIEWPLPGQRGWANPTLRASRMAYDLYRLLPRGKTLIIFISDFLEAEAVARAYAERLGKVERLGHEIVAIMPLTIAFEAQQLGRLAPLYRLLSLERIEEYDRIRRVLHSRGIPTIAAGPRDILQVLLARIDLLAG